MIAAFLGCLLILFLLFQYLTWHPSEHEAPLMNVSADPRNVRGVEVTRRFFCPRRAQRALADVVHHEQLQGVVYRDGEEWILSVGRDLSLTRADGGTSPPVYYLRRAAPRIETEVPNADAVPHSVIDPTVLVGGGVTRHTDLATARAAWDAAAAVPDETVYLYYNGPSDPTYYVVRTKKGASNAVRTDPALTGTVYRRRA